jgi:hypothetical protein
MEIALTAKEHEYGMLLKKAGNEVIETSYFNVVERKISEVGQRYIKFRYDKTHLFYV